MRSYLIYSSSAHFLILAVIFLISRGPLGLKKSEAYYIDFIGPSQVVSIDKAAAPEGAQGKAGAPQPKAAAKRDKPDPDDFSASPLPKPSVLAGGAKLFEEEKKAQGEGGENGTPLITDSANFPYPWYITQVRETLWNAWTGKMPSAGSLKCTVRFTINRDGSVKGVAVEKSSGNRLFDNAAETSVEGAAPFASLPDDFYEDRLNVHVEFKAMQ